MVSKSDNNSKIDTMFTEKFVDFPHFKSPKNLSRKMSPWKAR